MSEFETIKETDCWIATELVSQNQSINLWNPRGGSSIITVQESIVIFGGADRNQTHFNDLIICRKPNTEKQCEWEKVETTGDIPTPRSGHAVASHGRYMFLFGGIDFSEDVVYNDLYTLNIDTLEWKYVGEAGAEIPKRNSHTLMIVSNEQKEEFFLVVYGGASPDEGVFADSYYAILPSIDKIGSDDFYVNWITFESCQNGPGGREMHSSCRNGSAVILGGRSEDGSLQSDVWILSVNNSTGALIWERSIDLELSTGRCAHGATIVNRNLCVYGGFTINGIVGDLIVNLLLEADEGTGEKREWRKFNCSMGSGGRFGMAICTAPNWISERNSALGICLFGGVSAENDFGDIWYFDQVKK